MAQQTATLYATKTGYVKYAEPNTVFVTNPNTEYEVSGRKYLIFGTESFPDELKYYKIENIQLNVCGRSSNISGYGTDVYYAKDFNPQTLTYNNSGLRGAGSSFSGRGATILIKSTSAKNFSSAWGEYATNIDKSEYASKIARSGTFAFLYDYAGTNVYVKTSLLNNSPAYMTVTYDDAVTIKSTISMGLNQIPSPANPTSSYTVTWSLIRDESNQDYYCVADSWEQESARFYYRDASTGSTDPWHYIEISGDEKRLTIPPNTFHTGGYYNYYVSATDVLGNTSTSRIFTFTTPTPQLIQSNCPTAGYSDPRNDTVFSWYYSSSVGTFPAGDTTLHWRVSGESNWTNVNATTGANSLTIAANTFPTAETIEWYLSGTDATGFASETPVYSFSTSAGLITVNLLAPINTVETNNSEITLSWTYVSADGAEPSRFIIKYKLITASEWTTLVDSTTITTTYEVPAHTFPVGEVQWSVVAYNVDDVDGGESEASFLSYGAPEAPTVYAENKPFSTITWQAQGQQAYEISVGDKTYGPYFGEEKEFKLPDMLEDGQYTVKVRIIGTYNLLSEWGETAIEVENIPGAEITLIEEPGEDVVLSWETESEEPEFFIYRDGIMIGKTNRNTFTDRFSQGEHEYYIINKLDSGYYTKSNEVRAGTIVTAMQIALVSGGAWIEIKFTLNDQSDPRYEETAQTVYNHLAGDTFPTGIISGYQETNIQYSAVFLYTQEEAHANFRALFGKPVILKLKDGTVFVGIFDSWTRQPKKSYYTSYTFKIRRIEWEDFVDDTQ